jgi:hypothetical protein
MVFHNWKIIKVDSRFDVFSQILNNELENLRIDNELILKAFA